MTDTQERVEIPADVRDNSETVTDYAFMRHRSPERGIVTSVDRDRINRTNRDYLGHRYDYYAWSDVSPGGQRCRFDMWVCKEDGQVTHLFHTEYYTRVGCEDCSGFLAQSYADRYQVLVTEAGTSVAVPRCGEHADRFRRSVGYGPHLRVIESKRLHIGQHD